MSVFPASTHNCSLSPRLPDGSCATCRAALPASPAMPFVPILVTAKTPGIAVLLSMLWFGAGHLYANKAATGVILMMVDAAIGCIALTGLGLIVAVPVWIVMAPIVAALSAQATKDYNRRNGVFMR